jgi:glycosyltransferase 2 family protein
MSTNSLSIVVPERRSVGRSRPDIIWAVIWLAMSAAAVYLVVPRVGELQTALGSIGSVQPVWLATGAALVLLRYVLSTVALRAAVGQRIAFGPTLLVQVSSSFIGRLTPEGVGWLVLNQRFLEQAGIPRASALAAIGLKVFAAALTRLAVMVIVFAMVGTTSDLLHFEPVHVLGIATVVLAVGLIACFALRSRVPERLASVAAAARDLVAVLRQPGRAAVLLASSAGLPMSYALALVACAIAFGADAPVVEVLAVYLGGTFVAAASPTPGNLGAVEVTLSAGLTAVGVPAASAIGAVVMYRLLTFWIPLVPGLLAFRYLQHQKHI